MPQARVFPEPLPRPSELTITPWSYQSIGVELYGAGQGALAASQNFVTADLGVFIPFGVPEAMPVTKMFWVNGTAVAGNLDVGIYDTAGNRLVSAGSTTQAGANGLQIVNVTDTVLDRGLYYIGFASDTSGATQKVMASLMAAPVGQSFGLLQMAAAFPLPNPATFARYTSAFFPLVGLQGYRTVGP